MIAPDHENQAVQRVWGLAGGQLPQKPQSPCLACCLALIGMSGAIVGGIKP